MKLFFKKICFSAKTKS